MTARAAAEPSLAELTLFDVLRAQAQRAPHAFALLAPGRRPLTYAALMLPAWFAGWPAYDLAMVYPNQPGWIPYPGDLANPWIFFSAWARETGKQLYWVGFVGVALSAIAVATRRISIGCTACCASCSLFTEAPTAA